MSIKLYTGRMGSGKTFEVVSVVILAALACGRRVVTNIAGLNFDVIRDYLISTGIVQTNIGVLVSVSHDDVLNPLFWITDKDTSDSIKDRVNRAVQCIFPGDLVVLDEIWRFWDGFGRKMPPQVMNFFRMHRHLVDSETGVTCDVGLITQDRMDLSRTVRAVVEEIYYFEKLTVIGSAERYRVDIFQGGSRPAFVRSIQKKYDPVFFPMYKSHSKAEDGVQVVEQNIDQRGNILKGALFKIVLPLSVPIFGLAIWYLYRFFHPAPVVRPDAHVDQPALGSQPAGSVPGKPSVSSDWRVVGVFSRRSAEYVYLLADSSGRARFLVDPPRVKVSGWSVQVELPEGGFATGYSGSGGMLSHAKDDLSGRGK